MATITLTLDDADQVYLISLAKSPWLEEKIGQARREQVNHCSACGKPVTIIDGRIGPHTGRDYPGELPGMPCPATGTELWIAAGCTCERVIDECRCSG